MPLVRQTGAPIHLGDGEMDKAIAAMVSARVGGAYWARQPRLPEAPYTLVAVADRTVRARLLERNAGDRRLLCWTEAKSASQGDGSDTMSISGPCDPWHLVSGAAEVISDPGGELAIIATMSGIPVRDPAEGVAPAGGDVQRVLRATVRDRLGGHFAYTDPFTGEAMSLAQAVELCAFWRGLIDGNRPLSAAIGFAAWKRPTVAPLLWAGSGEVPFAIRPRAVATGNRVAAWKSRVADATLAALEDRGAELIEVEDGFIRSVGLGADCVPPLSIVVDRRGIFFDPRRPSDLEDMLQHGAYPPDLVDRARRLRELIVEAGVSKYDIGQEAVERRAGPRRHLLVPGQVEDDRSVISGGGGVTSNIELLRRVRSDAPDAFILYKPHPDVEAGHRVGAIADDVAAHYADEVVRNGPITSLIDIVDEVHVNTSLAGFEALLRGKPVTTHGVPFYAGWGLTRDLGDVPQRRTARRSLDELVAAVLLLYPRYLDPATGLPCTPEILVRRLAERGGAGRDGPLVPLRRLQGYVKRRVSALRKARPQ